jgi:hypothetical protein
MTNSLNERGIREGLMELLSIRKALLVSEKEAEASLAKFEEALTAFRRLRGYVDIQIEERTAQLRALEQAKEGASP